MVMFSNVKNSVKEKLAKAAQEMIKTSFEVNKIEFYTKMEEAAHPNDSPSRAFGRDLTY